MIFSLYFLRALAICLSAVAAPLEVETFNGGSTGTYIVTLKSGVNQTSFLQSTKIKATHNWTLINGFACALDGDTLNALRTNTDVESLSEDGVVEPYGLITQNTAPWGLSRISQAQSFGLRQSESALNFQYTFDDSAGSGVDIYVIGVYVDHFDFGGRARWGATFGPYPSQDLDGHGTHCAGTAAGSRFGVAKNASIIAVKVLGEGANSTGHFTDIISGLDWVLREARSSRNPSVASLSLGGPRSNALDSAVTSLASAGVHVVAAAGNENVDARNLSPAAVPSVITVGASSFRDQRSSFSNFGPAVDIFAPGQTIIAPWIGSPNATVALDGTSMAAPHVSGLVAYLIALEGNMSPGNMLNRVQGLALRNVLRNIPFGTANLLAQNGAVSRSASTNDAISINIGQGSWVLFCSFSVMSLSVALDFP